MKIIGAKNLDANNYRAISIHKNINVIGSSLKDGIIVSEPLTKTLKGKSEEEKIEEVIRYFLRNHTISMLYEDKNEISIISNRDVELRIGRNHIISKELIREIKEKFYMDRMEVYNKSDVDFYWIASNSFSSSQTMSYNVGTLKYIVWSTKGLPSVLRDKECMEINVGRMFRYENGEYVGIPINSRNSDFFNRILDDTDSISFYTDVLNESLCIYEAKKDDKKIYFVVDKEVWQFIQKIESKQENKIKIKKMQMRMEEF